MANIRINLSAGSGDYTIDMNMPETNGQAWGSDQTHLDDLVDEAVRRIKRAYTAPPESEDGEEKE